VIGFHFGKVRNEIPGFSQTIFSNNSSFPNPRVEFYEVATRRFSQPKERKMRKIIYRGRIRT
jgi:hypothetical protein